MQRKRKTREKERNAERRGLTDGTGHGREVANEISYSRGEKEKRERGRGLNKNSRGRMCYNEEEINRKEEAEMKRSGCRDQR